MNLVGLSPRIQGTDRETPTGGAEREPRSLFLFRRDVPGLVFGLKPAVEPAREIAHRLGHGVLGIVRRRLLGRTLAFDLDRYGVFLAVATFLAFAELNDQVSSHWTRSASTSRSISS